MIGDVPLKILLPEKIWKLRNDEEQFKQAVRDYINKGYPGWKIIRTSKPYAICRDERLGN